MVLLILISASRESEKNKGQPKLPFSVSRSAYLSAYF